ncbi:hypothetical protein GLP59_15360 [Sulfitobacter sp. M220]|uniref:hypothetical protein n=1 Tax=Sulfitobacter sp. M220 TaxID=2675333 RepID=UPI001F1B7A51|nr:hypothetical protein [Sulfitobacter sp. M220]MCF7779003.1 hypothetical protein [Sulfitobacter sp. M220]
MTISRPTGGRSQTELATIEGIQRGLADIETGRTVSHEAAMTSLRKIIAAEE